MELQWRIKGFIKDPYTQEWKKLNPNAKEISSLLVSRYISYLSSILNQNTTLTNLSSNEINNIMKLIIAWVKNDLRSNASKYGLNNDYTERSRVGHILLNSAFFVMKRAQNGMESQRIFKILNLTENYSQQPKKGLKEALQVWK